MLTHGGRLQETDGKQQAEEKVADQQAHNEEAAAISQQKQGTISICTIDGVARLDWQGSYAGNESDIGLEVEKAKAEKNLKGKDKVGEKQPLESWRKMD